MPIKGLSEQNRLPRLGKIRLGIKVNSKCPKCSWEGFSEEGAPHCPLCATKVTFKKAHPKATSYFVCPPEVRAVYGDEPTELDIMFPLNNLEGFAPQWYRAYSLTQGCVCWGDGETCERKVDTKTGAMASHETPEGRWEKRKGLPCNPDACPEFTTKRCKAILNLMILLPRVPGGMGVWQIDTGSVFGIIAINSMARLLLSLTGRCSFIPLKLKLGPRPVSPPGMKKKTVHTMYVEVELTLTELALMAQQAPAQVLLPAPDLTDVEATFYSAEPEEEEESEPAAEPPRQAEEIEALEEVLDKETPQEPSTPSERIIECDPSLIRNKTDFDRACHEIFQLDGTAALRLTGTDSVTAVKNWSDTFLKVVVAQGARVVEPSP